MTVRVGLDAGVALVTLDDPERRNALSLKMVEEVVDAFDRLEADDAVGAVVVTGAAPAFCAGADLSHLSEASEEGLLAVYEGFLRVGRCPLPTIAAVNGAAVGAGFNLALSCDVRLAARSARFDAHFLDLALHPGGGNTWMLRQLVGAQAAAAAVLFGEALDGDAAERCGLAWRCVDDDNLLSEAHAFATKAAAAPRPLVMKMKETLVAMGEVADHAEAVQVELGPQVWSMEQPEFGERLRRRP